MRGMPRAGLLALLLLGLPATSARAIDEKLVHAAVERGVWALKRLQQSRGTWPHDRIGATALAALTLMECDIPTEDPSIQAALKVLRTQAPKLNDTYSISLSILFFDRLGDPKDVPLIESLVVRLLAGQQPSGSWSYNCPPLPPDEVKRLQGITSGDRELSTKPGLGRPTGEKKRKFKDLSPEIRRQLEVLARTGPGAGDRGFGAATRAGDNSNTQFAVLALWVGRRYGMPIEGALTRVNHYFRVNQNPDGGWSYSDHAIGTLGASSAAMTCSGLLGLVVAHGLAKELVEDRAKAKTDPKPGPRGAPPRLRKLDVKKDIAVRAGLLALSSAVGQPAKGRRPVPRIGGYAYYFLWSLERVSVALDLKTIGGKDWYEWGAELLLVNQHRDGSWASGNYSLGGADTCFALLFLKRSNLASDLTTRLGGTGDLAKELRSGGVGGDALKGGAATRLPSPLEPTKGSTTTKPPSEVKPGAVAPGRVPEETEADRLANAVLRAPNDGQRDLLDKLSSTRGAENTQALREVIARAEEELAQKARSALAMRFTRLKATTLKVYLGHEDSEYRQAAALALGMKDSRANVPDLIRVLSDREPTVVRAARTSLKALTRQDFGPEPGATRTEKARAIAQWERWWALRK